MTRITSEMPGYAHSKRHRIFDMVLPTRSLQIAKFGPSRAHIAPHLPCFAERRVETLAAHPPILQLNYYRLEAGRFGEFVSYGLKSFAHEGVT